MYAQINTLQQLTQDLLCLGIDDGFVYADSFQQLNSDVYEQAEVLYSKKTRDDGEAAILCVTLLKAYHNTIYNRGDKEEKIQALLDRSWKLLDQLPDSVLKCQLLIACYEEVYEEELMEEVRRIMSGWELERLSEEQSRVIEEMEGVI